MPGGIRERARSLFDPADPSNRDRITMLRIGKAIVRDHPVWGIGPETPSRSLDTHVSRLRNKLDLRPSRGFLLSAIYGLGYRLEAVDSEDFAVSSLEAGTDTGVDADAATRIDISAKPTPTPAPAPTT